MTNLLKGYSFSQNKLGLYIHFPYCIHKCAYCDFFSLGIGKVEPDSQKEYFEILRNELDFRLGSGSFPAGEVDTIFFGGGTPSLADHIELDRFMGYIRKVLPVSVGAEISLEANPEDINLINLRAWSNMGINRINVGIQSFHPELLKQLDRFYIEKNYNNVLDHLSSSIIPRYGIDLIYGIVDQTKEMFYEDVQKAIQAGVKHLSCYSLTVEKGTNYSRWIKAKKALPPQEELQLEILMELPIVLEKYGYLQYEVSNFSLSGEECRHNLGYWLMKPYLGLGPGAHGYSGMKRYANPRSLEAYLKGNYDRVGESTKSFIDFILCTFRIFSPVYLPSFKDFWRDIEKFEETLEEWKRKGDCLWEDGLFQWNPKVLPYLDSYILELSNLREKII